MKNGKCVVRRHAGGTFMTNLLSLDDVRELRLDAEVKAKSGPCPAALRVQLWELHLVLLKWELSLLQDKDVQREAELTRLAYQMAEHGQVPRT